MVLRGTVIPSIRYFSPKRSLVSPWLRVVAIGGVAVVVFDAVAATASKLAGFPYGNAAIGSWVIYFAVGYFAVKATNSIRKAALAGAIAGAIEATLGWGVSWMIAPAARSIRGSPCGPRCYCR